MNKKLIALLTLVMFVMSFTGMAFAATTNTALQVKTIEAKTGQFLGKLRISEKTETVGSISTGDQISLTLPQGVEFSATPAAITGVTATNAGVTFASATARTFTFNVATVSGVAAAVFEVDFGNAALKVDADSAEAGSVDVEVFSVNGGVTNGTVTLGTIVGGTANATALNSPSLELGKASQTLGTVRVIETATGALATGEYIKLTMPNSDLTFVNGTATPMGGYTGAGAVTLATGYPKIGDSGYSEIRFNVATASVGAPGVMEISLLATVASGAPTGDIKVKVSGDVASASLVLGEVTDYSVTLSAPEITKVYAGDDSQELKAFYIKEGSKASIVGSSRQLKIKLPEDMGWKVAPSISVDKGDATFTIGAATVSSDKRTATYTMPAAAFSTSAVTYKLEQAEVATMADKDLGDVELTFSGTSNIEGTLKVAEVVAPVTAEATSTDVVIGKQDQPVGDILITEAAAGKITAKRGAVDLVLEVRLDTAANFSSTPTVEVIEGDLDIDADGVKKSGNVLTIPIDASSTEASTIKVSNIKVDLTRTPAEGPYDFKITGTAVNRLLAAETAAEATAVAMDPSATDAADKFVGMNVVTPAPEEAGAVKEVKMTVGSTTYTTDGVEMTMDAAPYLKNGRTYFPVRYVAQAVGIATENVVWDPAERTVTIFKAERIVQVQIGSSQMLVNGIAVTMDAAPEVTNGRTMLPIRFVAQALGLVVDWDAATQTVALN